MRKLARLKVAEVISQVIAFSPKSRTQIASEIGCSGARIIKQYEEGVEQPPLNLVEPLAKVLGLDSIFLLRLAFLEYVPDMQEVIETLLGSRVLLTQNEINLIQALRKLTDYSDPPLAIEARHHDVQVLGVVIEMSKTIMPSSSENYRA